MNNTEVADLLEAFKTGRIRLDELREDFRQRIWPITRRPAPTTYVEMAEQQDPAEDLPGSFDDVTAAYDRGELTTEQYDLLAEAAAESICAHGTPQR
jgi:hypothetical protein